MHQATLIHPCRGMQLLLTVSAGMVCTDIDVADGAESASMRRGADDI